MPDANPHDDYRLIRQLIVTCLVVVFALVLLLVAYILAEASQMLQIRSKLEGLNCQVEERTLGPGGIFLVNVFHTLGAPTAAITPIDSIDASHAKLTDAGLIWVKGLGLLGSLDVTGTSVTDAGLDDLEGLRNLMLLNLKETQVTDAGLPKLQSFKALEYLVLEATGVTDVGMVPLEKIKSLTNLGLERTLVTDAGVERLQKALPHLVVER